MAGFRGGALFGAFLHIATHQRLYMTTFEDFNTSYLKVNFTEVMMYFYYHVCYC